MGKKTTGKKGHEREKNKPNSLEEVINNGLPMCAEDGVHLHNECMEKNENGHKVGDDDVDFTATQIEAVKEGDNDANEKKKKKKKTLKIRDGDELSASGNGVVMKDGVDEDERRRKNMQRNEFGGNDTGLSVSQVLPVVKDKKKKNENTKLPEVSGNIADFSVNQGVAVIDSDVHADKKKKKKKKKSKKRQEVSGNDFESDTSQKEAFIVIEGDMDKNNENGKDRKKKKRKLEINEDENETHKAKKKDKRINSEDVSTEIKEASKQKHLGLEENTSGHSSRIETGSINMYGHTVPEEDGKRNKKKKTKSVKKCSDLDKIVSRTKKDVEPIDPSENSRSKKVSFSDHVQVFPSSDGSSDDKNAKDDVLVRGKRFSLEEDEMIKKAVTNYIEAHRLGEEGINMILHCRSHPEVKNCWKEIGAALSWRPCESIYYRAHILFERDEKRKWTPEELELVRKFHEKHGSDWKMLANALGKHRVHVKDTWRRIRLPNQKKGQWSQEEYQKLFDLVNIDLRTKAFEEKKSKHGMLRDNISWEAISDKLETRSNAICCLKWYDQLTSPMVAEGKWADTDDYHLVNALSGMDACCLDDVDWDNLLEHRSGTICRKRWNQMAKHLGSEGNKSFPEQVEILSTRYCPDVLEAREAYNSQPAVK